MRKHYNYAVNEIGRPRVEGGTYKKTWRRLFTSLFVPYFIRRIYYDLVALKATYQDAKAAYKNYKKVTFKSLHFARNDIAFIPKSFNKKHENILRPLFSNRIGNLRVDDVDPVKRTNRFGENLYEKAGRARLKTVNALKGSKYPFVPYIVLTIWMLRHVVFVRHFRGGLRNYIRLIPSHIYNDIIEFFNAILESDRFQFFYTFFFNLLLLAFNLTLIGPLYRKTKSFSLHYFPFLGKINLRKVVLFPFKILGFFTLRPLKATLRFIGRPRDYNQKEFPFLRFCWSLFYFIYFFTARFLYSAWRLSCFCFSPISRAFGILGVCIGYFLRYIIILFIPFVIPFLVRAFIIVGHTGLILLYFIKKTFVFLIPTSFRSFSIYRWCVVYLFEPFSYYLYYAPLVIFYRVRAISYAILVFKARLSFNRAAHCYRHPEPKIKLNPIRRLQLKYNKFKYALSRYQLENILHLAVLYLFTIPLFFYNTIYKKVGNMQIFHRIFWRGFLAERFPLFFSRWTSKQERKRHFSVLSQKDDLSITNFFSFDSSFRKNRYLIFELQDWEIFELFEKFEREYREFIVTLRAKRKKVRQRAAFLVSFLRGIPSGLFRFLFGKGVFNIFSHSFFFPAKLWDFTVSFISLLLYGIYLCFAYPFYFFVYIFNKLLNYKQVFVINISRFDTYKVFGLLRFVILSFVSLILLLEFFYFFGWHILFVQNVAMKWLDAYTYNWLFLILLPHFILSFVSPFFAGIWREAKYYFLVYPAIVQSWIVWWMIKHAVVKKYMLYGIIIKTTKHSLLVDDYLKAVLLLFYTTMNPISATTKRASFKRPYEASEIDASQFLFDYVTSLFS